jgi:adenosylcobinamide-GDP ribazoletransferase
LARLQQLVLAAVFLTRLPLGRLLPPRVMPLAEAAWAFPLVGALIGAVAALPLWAFGPGLLPAALALALAVWLTGALHEDALADFADAGGGRDRADRLRIMREPTVGSFGTMALLCVFGLRLSALAVLAPWHLVAAMAAGRAAAAGLMLMPAARADGLGQGAGRPAPLAVGVAAAIAVLILLLAPGPALLPLLGALAAAAAVGLRARRLVGGQTGDVLGAASLCAETAVLVTFALLT